MYFPSTFIYILLGKDQNSIIISRCLGICTDLAISIHSCLNTEEHMAFYWTTQHRSLQTRKPNRRALLKEKYSHILSEEYFEIQFVQAVKCELHTTVVSQSFSISHLTSRFPKPWNNSAQFHNILYSFQISKVLCKWTAYSM